jgi:predicted Ser/Thr protein kinase
VKQHVGSYEIVRLLARGGMAVVYLAHQPALDRRVALKQLDLQSAEPSVAQRFVREARLAAGLDHPNVVTLFDFFEDGGVPYIAMEYVRGGSLRPLVGRLSLPQVFGVLEGVLAGLAHAEAHGIAHRDLKPENVLVTQGGKVKIADFGIARAYDALTPALTSTGTAIGTPTYMAPEQALNEPLGPYTDIYALGVVAYELLAGRPPFAPGRTPMAVLYCHVHKAPPPLTDHAPEVPEPVRGWVDWLLAKPPADRPVSAAAAWEALEEIAVAELGPYWRRSAAIAAPEPDPQDATTLIDVPVEPTPLAPDPPARPRSRRRLVAGAAAGTALVVSAAAVAVWGPGSDTPRTGAPASATRTAAKPKPKPAAPYDFDGDGAQELVIGMPGAGPAHAGVVMVRGRRAGAAANRVLTAADAELGPLRGDEDFGTSISSADFDGDGHADLAVSAPGSDQVVVIHGTAGGLRPARVEHIHASEMRYLKGAGKYGSRLLASDFNRDGLADLLVGAPAADTAGTGSGAIQILFGGRAGMKAGQPQTIFRPVDDWSGFGTKVRTGDINGDGNVDLVEGAPDARDGSADGHASYCFGRRSGRFKPCVALTGPVSSGTSALAIADLNGDHRGDIIQGDSIVEPKAIYSSAPGGEVRVWLGGRSGPARKPIVIDQRPFQIPGADEPGDGFGTSVDAGDLDGDGYADMVVCTPYDDEGGVFNAGTLTIIRGGRSGIARAGHTRFDQANGLPGHLAPGARVGYSVSVIDVAGDRKLDVVVAVPAAEALKDSVYVLRRRGKGAFAPGETSVWRPLRGHIPVRDPRIDQIRFGRLDGALT